MELPSKQAENVEELSLKDFTPLHLLKFDIGDINQDIYFRHIIQHCYQHKLDVDDSRCSACFKQFTVYDKPRIQGGMKKSREIQKLLLKSENGKLSKNESNIVKRYLKSPSYLTVTCRACGQVNRQTLLTNAQKLQLKQAILAQGKESSQQSHTETETQSLSQKKKKKKKKKGKEDGQQERSSLIQVKSTQSIPSKKSSTQPKHQEKPKKGLNKQELLSILSDSKSKSGLKDFLSTL